MAGTSSPACTTSFLTKAGQIGNLVAASSRYGKWFHYFNGLDLTFDLRTVAGFTFLGGASTGQTVADNCAVRERLPELSTTTTGTSAFGAGLNGSVVSPASPYCHVAFGILTQFRGLASYVFRKARHPGVNDVSEQTRRSTSGELRRAEFGGCAFAGQKSFGERAECDGEPRSTRHDVWRSDHRARSSSGEGLPARWTADAGGG